MSRRYAVIGAGGWGTAVACHLANAGHEVVLCGHDADYAQTISQLRRNPKYLPNCQLPDSVKVTSDAAMALESCQVVLSVVPTRAIRSMWSNIGCHLRKKTPIVSLTKGIENNTLLRPTEILREILGRRPIAVLSGPSHAEEVVHGAPTTVTVATVCTELGKLIQRDFASPTFRVYTNRDVIGVELGGAVKNVIAIAAGIVDGLGFGDNTKAALLTRGLAEIVALGTALGARRRTFFGMAGVGDLITTAFSKYGRNRAVGERIGRGELLEDILKSMAMVAEGVGTTQSVHDLANRMHVEMPITHEIYRVLFQKKDPRRALTDLMTRRSRTE